MFDNVRKALLAIGIAGLIAAAAAVEVYILCRWTKHRRAMGITAASST